MDHRCSSGGTGRPAPEQEIACYFRTTCLLAWLGELAGDLRVDAEVVEWSGDDRHYDRACLAAGRLRPAVVVTLSPGEGADDQPHDEQYRAVAHTHFLPPQAPTDGTRREGVRVIVRLPGQASPMISPVTG